MTRAALRPVEVEVVASEGSDSETPRILFSMQSPMRLLLCLVAWHTCQSLQLHGGTCLARPIKSHGAPIIQMMGRAEKRMAKKRAKKGPQYQGGRPLVQQGKTSSGRDDVVPRSTVCARLSEVPVFGLIVATGAELPRTSSGYYAPDGVATFFVDLREAEMACSKLPAGTRCSVVGAPLGEVYFDSSHQLKPSQSCLREATTVPTAKMLVPDVSVPLFCIDGMQTTAKDTGVRSLPLFFSKEELLEFATPVYGAADAKERVLLTDLAVVVSNMVNGPAGLLRDAKFFAPAPSLTGMDRLEANQKQDVFGLQGSLEAYREREQGLFGGMKMPWT